MPIFLMFGGALMFLVGVALYLPPQKYAQEQARKYPRCIPPLVTMDMSKEDLLNACGPPDHINHQIINAGGSHREQWSYNKDGVYVYLYNDRVDSIQYAENGQRFEWKH